MAKSATKWLPLFRKYIKALRIQSKHAASDPDGTGIELKLWASQQRVLEQICDGLENGIHIFYCLKSRQLGVTTITLAITLFWLALHPNTIGCMVSDSDKNAAKNRETIRRYVQSLSGFMGKTFSIQRDNKFGFVFANGSRLDMLVAGKSKVNWGEGEGYILGHLTEIASFGKEEGLESFRHSMAPDNPRSLYIFESPLALDTPLPTPDGWTTMGDVKEGDYLFDEGGKPCRVLGTSPVLTDRKCYRVEFCNGDYIIADANHEWQVRERRWATNPQWKVRKLPTIGLDPENHRILVSEPLDLPDADLPIDPYLLGVWLGDGRTDSPRITAGDHDIEEFRALLRGRGCDPGPISKSKDRIGAFTVMGERRKFASLGLLGNKHIPRQYLRASEKQRRLLLAGLMDTDGSIDKRSFCCNFTSTLPVLIDGVGELLSSLGIKWAASPAGVEGEVREFPTGSVSVCKASTRYLFHERPERDVFLLERKRLIQRGERGPQNHVWRKTKYLKIESVTEVESVPVKCVSVDSPSHLFLAGRTMVPTHNTAHGPNHWKDMWEAARNDEFSSRCIFVGWWSHDLQRIKMSDPKWKKFGTYEPTPEENELITQVKNLYGYEIKMEQLAWYRWQQTMPNSGEGGMDQNQPFTEDQCFVQSGVSFFQNRLIAQRRQFIIDANEEVENRQEAEGKEIDPSVENGGFGYKVFQFYLADEYHLCKCEAIDHPIPADQIKLRVWEKPNPEGLYVIGVDPAGGRSEDSNNHGISVWRCFADKMVQVAEWADSIPETRHCAWVTAYLAGQYQNCRINIDLTGGIGSAVMQAFEDLRSRMRSEMYQQEIAKLALEEMERNRAQREADGKPPTVGHNGGPKWEFDDFLPAANWHLYRRIDSPGPGFMYNTKLGVDLKFKMMNGLRDSWVTNLLEIRSIPLLDEMSNVVQTRGDIGASAPGRQRDDRTFAMALANWTWLDNLRGGLISQGLTWDGAKKKESGQISPLADQLNRRVFSILRAADEMSDLPPPRTYYEQRGL